MTKHKHRPCPCGCGELADECMSPRTGLGGAFQLEPGDAGQAILPATGSPSVKDQGASAHYKAPQWITDQHAMSVEELHSALSYIRGYGRNAYDRGIAFSLKTHRS